MPDARLRDLLIARAHAGVDVRVIAPGDKNDVDVSKVGQRRSYAPLLAAGIRIYEYQPTMMHAKAMSSTTASPSSARSTSIRCR